MGNRSQLKRRLNALEIATFQDVTGRLIHLLTWMEETEECVPILKYIEEQGGGDLLSAANRNGRPPEAFSLEQIVSVGLALIQVCKKQPGTQLYALAMATGIHGRGSNDAHDYSDAALNRYVQPFLTAVVSALPDDEPSPKVASKASEFQPPEIAHSLARFRADYPDPEKVGFLVMRFEETPAHTEIMEVIKTELEAKGLKIVRADGKRYHDDLFPNVLTYLYGCSFAVAIFERITTDEFNPNVSLEVGYLMAMHKPVLLLKDKNLKTMQTDLVGRIYDPFDFQKPAESIPIRLSSWLRDKGITV